MLTPHAEEWVQGLLDQTSPGAARDGRYKVESIGGGYRLAGALGPVVRGQGGFARREDADFTAAAPVIVRELLIEVRALRPLACALARHLDNAPCPACSGGCGEHEAGCEVQDLLAKAAVLASVWEGVPR